MIHFDDGTYFSYDMIGEFRSSGEWLHSRRTINNYELILVTEGVVKISEKGFRYTLTPGTMILLEPNTEHYGWEASCAPTGFYWFHFFTNLPMPFKILCEENIYDIKQLLKRLLHISNTPNYANVAADALGYLVFEELTQFKKETASGSAVISEIKEYIRNNRSVFLTVSEIAAHFGYHTDYLGKLFKKKQGIGLKQYLAEQRLIYAKDLLLNTDMHIKQVATALGYRDENLFIKFFLYHESISPTAFKNKYYNTHINSR